MCPVSFDDSMIGKMAAETKPAPGKFAFQCIAAAPHQSKNNPDNIGAQLMFKCLENPEDPSSIVGETIRVWVTFPLRNDAVEGHVPPDRAGEDTCRLLSAMCEDVLSLPVFDRDTGMLMFSGEAIEQAQRPRCKAQAIKSGAQKAVELWGEHGEGLGALVGSVIFAELYYQQGSDFPKLRYMSPECPEDWELSDEYVITEEVEMEEEPEVKPKKRSRKKRG